MIHEQLQIMIVPVFFSPLWAIAAQRKTFSSRGAPEKTGDSLLMDVNVVDTTEDIPGGVHLQLIDNWGLWKDAH